jgi:hypothetical protein
MALVPALLAIWTAPAGAVIQQVKEGTETIEVGVQQRKPPTVKEERLQWHGGPVNPASYVYAIYWDPVQAYHNDWMQLIDGYLHNVGADSGKLSNVFALTGQYRSADGTRASYQSTFRGAYTDTFEYPAVNDCHESHARSTCLTDKQIRTELLRFVAAEHLPTGREVTYLVLTPPAVTVCLDGAGTGNCSTSGKEIEEEATSGKKINVPGPPENATGFCGYHSIIEPNVESNSIVYGVQPWIAGHAGHVINEIPLVNELPTGAALACQNGKKLVEPDQATSFVHFNSYETGLADLIINGLSMVQTDIVIDPRLSDGWYQNTTSLEQTDMCRWVFSPPKEEKEKEEEKLSSTEALKASNELINSHAYYLQYSYSSVAATSGQEDLCWSGVELEPHFTATNVVKGGDIVAFDALESGVTLDANLANLASDEPFTAPIYMWEFGDGTSVGPTTQASVFHTYQYGGNYSVKLTVTDSGGNAGVYTQLVPISGPAPPSPPGGGSSGASSPTTGGASAAPTNVLPGPGSGPSFTQSILSHSLKKALSSGLPVHYNVNTQVAGRVEVLLDSSTAARLHIKGRTATGLPKGYPRELLVGSAVLVTTRAGGGTVRIKFSRTIAARLAKAHQVKLTLRFVLRSVSGGATHTTTTLSTVVLSH